MSRPSAPVESGLLEGRRDVDYARPALIGFEHVVDCTLDEDIPPAFVGVGKKLQTLGSTDQVVGYFLVVHFGSFVHCPPLGGLLILFD
jgi:hypothetical protein